MVEEVERFAEDFHSQKFAAGKFLGLTKSHVDDAGLREGVTLQFRPTAVPPAPMMPGEVPPGALPETVPV